MKDTKFVIKDKQPETSPVSGCLYISSIQFYLILTLFGVLKLPYSVFFPTFLYARTLK